MNSFKYTSTILVLLFLFLSACASNMPTPPEKSGVISTPPKMPAETVTSIPKSLPSLPSPELLAPSKGTAPTQQIPTLPPLPKDLVEANPVMDSLSPTNPPLTLVEIQTAPGKPDVKITLTLAKNAPNSTEESGVAEEPGMNEASPSQPALTEESAPADTSFNAWCLPMSFVDPDPKNPAPAWKMPQGASPLTYSKKQYELTVPATACYFTYTASQAVSGNLKLLVSDYSAANTHSAPWLVKDMAAADDDPSLFWVEIKHDYIRNPPFWFVAYKFTVQSGDEQDLWVNDIYINRGWRPNLCDTGLFPDPTTLKCKKWQDMHPWDPWYTPVPPEPTEVPGPTRKPE